MRSLPSTVGCCVLLLVTSLGTSVLHASDRDQLQQKIAELKSPKSEARMAAVRQLSELGPYSAPAVPELTRLMLDDPDLGVRHEAILTLGHIGSASQTAVPGLRRMLSDDSGLIRHAAALSLMRIGPEAISAVGYLQEALKDKEPIVRVAAAQALLRLAPSQSAESGTEVAVLVAELANPDQDVRRDAVKALEEAGKVAVPLLTKMLEASEPATVIATCDALAGIGNDANTAIPEMLSLLKSPQPGIRWHAAEALGTIAVADPGEVVAAIIPLLSDPKPLVRLHTAHALGSLGEAAAPATPALAKLLADDEEIPIRLAALHALADIGEPAASAVPAIAALLDGSVGTLTVQAAATLERLGPKAVPALVQKLQDKSLQPLIIQSLGGMLEAGASAVPDLVSLLKTAEPERQQEILLALGMIGPGARDAVPSIREIARATKEPKVIAAAIFAIVKIDGEGAAEPLQKTLRSSTDPTVRLACAWGLMTLRSTDPEDIRLSVGILEEGLKHKSPLVRKEAAGALALAGPAARDSVPKLVALLDDPEFEVRWAGLQALMELGPVAITAIPRLRELLQQLPEGPPRHAVVYTLGKIGPRAKSVAPTLLEMLHSSDEQTKAVAGWALARIAPSAEADRLIIPVMIHSLLAADPHERKEAATTLGLVGQGSEIAKLALDRVKNDPDPGVRAAVKVAIEQIGD